MTDTPTDILVLAGPDDHPWPGLEGLDPAEARVRQVTDEADFADALPEAQVLVMTDFRSGVLERHWHRAKALQWVHATSAGVDALLFDQLNQSDIPVTNARGVFDDMIGEYVLGLMLVFAKDLHTTLRLQSQRRWQHRDSQPLSDSRLLVVGAGGIGRAIGQRAAAMGVHVVGVARSDRPGDDVFERIVGNDKLNAELAQADYVAIATPLTPETRHLFDAEAFAQMKPGARLINIGRGPVVDTEALVEALRTGRLAGAALDVFEEEPLPEDHPLWDMEQVIVSPHMAGDAVGWRRRLSAQFVDLFEDWRAGRPLGNLVDKRRGYVAAR